MVIVILFVTKRIRNTTKTPPGEKFRPKLSVTSEMTKPLYHKDEIQDRKLPNEAETSNLSSESPLITGQHNFLSLRKDKHAASSIKLLLLASNFYVFSELGSCRMSHYFNTNKLGNAHCKQSDLLFLISRFLFESGNL